MMKLSNFNENIEKHPNVIFRFINAKPFIINFKTGEAFILNEKLYRQFINLIPIALQKDGFAVLYTHEIPDLRLLKTTRIES